MPKLSQSASRIWNELRDLTGDVRDIGTSISRAVHDLPAGGTKEFEPLNPEIRFEHSDISVRNTVIVGSGLLLGLGILVCLLYFYFAFLARYRAASSPPPLAIEAHGTPLPPQPRIQISPSRDLRDQRAYEDSVLSKYRWVDRQKGIVGLPIERAMQLLAQHGIPPRKAPADLKLFPPEAGDRSVGFENKVAPEPR